MSNKTPFPFLLKTLRLACVSIIFTAPAALAKDADGWTLDTVIHEALASRLEITAANERVAAAQERPAIDSALEDPMLTPSIDHYPFKTMKNAAAAPAPMEEDAETPAAMPADDKEYGRYNWSVAIEQRFPFSSQRAYRRDAATADVNKASAETERTTLNIVYETISAFYMVNEKRRMEALNNAQLQLASQLAGAANSRYATGNGNQVDVLRVEMETGRLSAESKALQSQILAAQTMLNTNMSRAADAVVPTLILPALDQPIPDAEKAIARAIENRPELKIGSAEVERANADIKVMNSMYSPMGMVRVGYASTMAEGRGAMLMVGVSVPLWREKLRSGVAEAQAMSRMAHADLDAMRRMVKGEVIAARQELMAAQTRYTSLRDDVVPRAERLIAPTLATYSSGQGSLLPVIEAMQTLRDTHSALIMAESAVGVAWARFYRVTGEYKETRQ